MNPPGIPTKPLFAQPGQAEIPDRTHAAAHDFAKNLFSMLQHPDSESRSVRDAGLVTNEEVKQSPHTQGGLQDRLPDLILPGEDFGEASILSIRREGQSERANSSGGERRRSEPKRSHPYQRPATSPKNRERTTNPRAASSAAPSSSSTVFWLDNDQWKFIPETKLAQCLSCETLVLPTPDAIWSHDQQHDQNAGLRCGHNNCERRFTAPSGRTTHVKNDHGIIEQHCPFCETTIEPPPKYYVNLEEHFFSEHLMIQNWKCPFCVVLPLHLQLLYSHCRSSHMDKKISRQELWDCFIDRNTGLPCNAHFVLPGDERAITAYAKGTTPKKPNSVNWSMPPPIGHEGLLEGTASSAAEPAAALSLADLPPIPNTGALSTIRDLSNLDWMLDLEPPS